MSRSALFALGNYFFCDLLSSFALVLGERDSEIQQSALPQKNIPIQKSF